MAVDTRDKRSSIIGYALPFGVFPNPDGTLDEDADRVHISMLYSGVTPAGPAPSVNPDEWLLIMRRRRMMR